MEIHLKVYYLIIVSMENRRCTNCKRSKIVEEFNGMNRMCIECCDKSKEANKIYRQKEVFCDICQCNVKKCRLSIHLKIEKHLQNEKVKNDEEEN